MEKLLPREESDDTVACGCSDPWKAGTCAKLDEDIIGSYLNLECEVVQPDHDDAPDKIGNPLVEVTEESHEASQEASVAMEAMSEVSAHALYTYNSWLYLKFVGSQCCCTSKGRDSGYSSSFWIYALHARRDLLVQLRWLGGLHPP